MPVKVMVVEDSNFMRKATAALLSSDPGIQVVSTVSSGEETLEKLPSVKPDVITLDVNMPGMDGIETLGKIMKSQPTPVIMFSGYTKKGAEVTLEALNKGAIDFVTKPHGPLSLDLSSVRDELVEKVLASFIAKAAVRKWKVSATEVSRAQKVERLSAPGESILFIASSTGGVQALSRVVPFLPADFPMPLLIVQHMPPLFTGSLASSLDMSSKLSVKEAESGDVLSAGNVYIAPGGWQTIIRNEGGKKVLHLEDAPSDTSLKPCADISMDSISTQYGADSVALILTGMGNDGTEGAKLIKNKGGRVIVQNEATSIIFGMPGSVIEAGLSDAVLPIDKIAEHLSMLV